MKYKNFFLFLCAVVLSGMAAPGYASKKAAFVCDTLSLFDSARDRLIPIACYRPATAVPANRIPIILSHGYGANQGSDYLLYSYLASYLATRGYFVVSVQHELPTDELIPLKGKPQIVRRPNWERGVQNILFVLQEMKKRFPAYDYNQLALIGHSNGGDMSILFARQHPELLHTVISLDNRRMPLPRVSQPRIYTLRSNDYPADDDVLPTEKESRQYGITVLRTNINHAHMDDKARPEEKKFIQKKVLKFLEH